MLWHSRVEISYVVVHGRILAKTQILFDPQIQASTVLQPIDQNEHLVPHLKDLFQICLEPEGEGRSMILKPFYVKSKYP